MLLVYYVHIMIILSMTHDALNCCYYLLCIFVSVGCCEL
jgi:hypothetical protein